MLTLVGELNLDLKANLNGHRVICHSIQIWISLKKLCFHRKWQNHFTQKSVSILAICRNFIWMKNWIYISLFSAKFPSQCKEQTNSKVPSKHSLNTQGLIWVYLKNKLDSQVFYFLVYKFNVCFISLENLVYQNNPFIVFPIG